MIDRDAGNLRRRMDPGVGSPSRIEWIVRADDRIDLVFEHLLDGDRVCLALPTSVVGTVVRDRQFEGPGHLLIFRARERLTSNHEIKSRDQITRSPAHEITRFTVRPAIQVSLPEYPADREDTVRAGTS